jgi:hypothetical protein
MTQRDSTTTTTPLDLHELRAELALTRLGNEILESVEASITRGLEAVSDESRLAAFVAHLIIDLHDPESSGAQNRLRLTTNLEMAADRLLALARQLRSSGSSAAGMPEALVEVPPSVAMADRNRESGRRILRRSSSS